MPHHGSKIQSNGYYFNNVVYMKPGEIKNKKALFHGFPSEDNVEIKNVLDSIERTFLPIGSKIGRYKIIEEIDRGGMSVVYKACQTDLDRIVALKVLPANVTINRNFVERFLAEAHSVAKLHHPNIVNIYEVSVEENIYFLAMDYIPGKNLFYFLNQEKPKLVKVLEIVSQLSDALDYAHEQKILHRDLKLNNVIMKDDKTPVLIDFGLAKVIGGEDTDLTKTGEIIGSPAYMAPERIFGSGLDARSDICSLGIMFYEMLTFKNPYLDPRSMIQTTKNVVEANPVPPRNLIPWLPIEIESITLKAIAREPEDRYQTMHEFADDIKRYQRGDPVLASPPSLISKIRRFTRKHWASLVISSISLLFTLLILIIIAIQSGKERTRWQLAFDDRFTTEESLKNWSTHIDNKGSRNNQALWNVTDSSLWVSPGGETFLRLERLFTRDIKVEFDMQITETDAFNTGFFICGDTPDSGFCFWIHKDGTPYCGITYPGANFLFYDYSPLDFPPTSHYHVVIEKKDNIISFWLNDVFIAKINDFYPLLGKERQKIGFFSNGSSVSFDNLRVFRRALPRLARPTIIADRFWNQGDFETALAEYKEVLLDLPRSDLERPIKFKIIDCLIRLHKFDEAKYFLEKIEHTKNIGESERARILFLWGMLTNHTTKDPKKNKALMSMAKYFPTEPVTKSVATYMALDCYNLIQNNMYDSAETRVTFLTKKYPAISHHLGRIHLEVLRHYSQLGHWSKSYKIGKRIVDLHRKNYEILIDAKNLLALTHLGRREKSKAIDLLNQCVSFTDETPQKWEAWLILAQTYTYSNKYTDAFSIYKKIYTDCPKSLVAPWIACIRMGELVSLEPSLYGKSAESLFTSVITRRHVFFEPWLIAQFYLNLIDKKAFKKQWLQLKPHDHTYLYYFCYKHLMQEEYGMAMRYLRQLLKGTPQYTWKQVWNQKLLENIRIMARF